MLYRVNNSELMYYELGDHLPTIKSAEEEVFVVFDPGKTNMACIVGTVTGRSLAIFEFKGRDLNDKAIDTTDYCIQFSRFIKDVLKECKVYKVAQEQAILPNSFKSKEKRSKGRNSGMDHFRSNMVLTEVRSHIIMVSMDLTGQKPREVNNQYWKGRILPDGYRGRHEKGSYRFLSELNPAMSAYSHDVTDAYCIYLLLVQEYEDQVEIRCSRKESSRYEFTMSIMDRSTLPKGIKYFVFNRDYTCEENATYFANHFSKIGACKITLEDIDIKELYKYSNNLFSDSDPYMIVIRR